MSNYKRAYTPQNIVNSFTEPDIVEKIDSANNIWYIKTNGHEYLVDVGLMSSIVSKSIGGRAIGPRFRECAGDSAGTLMILGESESIPHLKMDMITGYTNSGATVNGDNRRIEFLNSNINTYYPLNQYYDFNQLTCNYGLAFQRSARKQVNPDSFTYIKRYSHGELSLDWGLPNIEVLLAIYNADGKNSLLREIFGNPVTYANLTPTPDYSFDFTIGFHTPFCTKESDRGILETYKIFFRFQYKPDQGVQIDSLDQTSIVKNELISTLITGDGELSYQVMVWDMLNSYDANKPDIPYGNLDSTRVGDGNLIKSVWFDRCNSVQDSMCFDDKILIKYRIRKGDGRYK